MPVVGLFMDWQRGDGNLPRLGVPNRTQYSAANAPFPALVSSTDIHCFHTIRHVYRSVWPARLSPRFGAALIRSAHDCATRLFHVLVFILDPRPTNATPVVTLVFASYSTFKTTFIIGSCHIYGTIVQCNRCSTILEFYIFIINLKIM